MACCSTSVPARGACLSSVAAFAFRRAPRPIGPDRLVTRDSVARAGQTRYRASRVRSLAPVLPRARAPARRADVKRARPQGARRTETAPRPAALGAESGAQRPFLLAITRWAREPTARSCPATSSGATGLAHTILAPTRSLASGIFPRAIARRHAAPRRRRTRSRRRRRPRPGRDEPNRTVSGPRLCAGPTVDSVALRRAPARWARVRAVGSRARHRVARSCFSCESAGAEFCLRRLPARAPSPNVFEVVSINPWRLGTDVVCRRRIRGQFTITRFFCPDSVARLRVPIRSVAFLGREGPEPPVCQVEQDTGCCRPRVLYDGVVEPGIRHG